jgi:hypothetical protein
MRDLIIRQTAAEALHVAQEAAIAAIGKRGKMARDAMRVRACEIRERLERTRWEAICRGAWRTRVNAPEENDAKE